MDHPVYGDMLDYAHTVHVNPNSSAFQGKMAEIAKKTNHSAVSLHFCCNDILYLNVHVLRINGTNQISMWWDMSDLHWKVGFTPWKTEHAPHYGQASYSGAYKNSEHGRPLGAKLRACQSWGPCSIHILKTPFFWLSQPPLILYSINILYNDIGSSLKDRYWGGSCQKQAKKGQKRQIPQSYSTARFVQFGVEQAL